MASDLFSLNWDDFHKNMSAGMNSLLESEDLVDVTIAVEGRYFKAHKMVLSVCSPYFRELFKVTPCKHPIVFLKDVSYVAMSDLLQFMYQGEVQVSQENLTTFIKTGEALQIKGLTDHGNTASECDNKPDETNKHVPESEETMPTSVIKTEPASVVGSTSSVEQLIQLKEEPCDFDDNFKEEPLDNVNEDYSLMEGVDEEPEAGSSADGTTGGQEESSTASVDLLPKITKERYQKEYEDFQEWLRKKNVTTVNEDILLAYMEAKSEVYSPTSLGTKVSMLKLALKVYDNIDISRFGKLFLFLRQKSDGYSPKKARILSEEEVTKFLLEADDYTWLLEKVILMCGMFGACRRDELVKLTVDDFENTNTNVLVTLRCTKNKKNRIFAIPKEGVPFDAYGLYKKYADLRPPNLETRRFFIGYKHGKCVKHVVGIHTIGAVPKKIAEFLKLENPQLYTGHSFRRSSATMFVENGGDLLSVKELGGWDSSAVAETYIEKSVSKRMKIIK